MPIVTAEWTSQFGTERWWVGHLRKIAWYPQGDCDCDSHSVNTATQHNLQILKDAMLFFSRSMPSLPTVILALDKINQVFATIAANWLFPTRIRAAISMAKHMLNHYYNHTDYSEVYHIAMGEYNIICANVMCFKGDLVLHPFCSSSTTFTELAGNLNGLKLLRTLFNRSMTIATRVNVIRWHLFL